MSDKVSKPEAEDYIRGFCTHDEQEEADLPEMYAIAKQRSEDRPHLAERVQAAGATLGLA